MDEPMKDGPSDLLESAFGGREILYLIFQMAGNLFLWNCLLFGGFNLGFALGTVGLIAVSWWYLGGKKAGWYPCCLLGLSVVIALGFARSDDTFVKLILSGFLQLAVNLGLCLMAGQNRRSPNGFTSLLDAPRALFMMGLAGMGNAARGLGYARRHMGDAGKKGSAAVVGLVVAVPVLALIISLLTSADAAFKGLLDKLPELDFSQLPMTLFFGGISFWILFSRGTSLRHREKTWEPARDRRGVNPITVHTVLGAVCLVYVVYLLSQLAYLSGGLSGILPEGFTMAEYARRGFFEMAWLCAINLTVIGAGVGLVRKEGKTPLATRLLCLFIGAVTVFLAVTASAKMFMYIGSYGLTRLRVLTEIIMVFLGLATVIVCLWIFLPRLPYMRIILLLALVMGGATLWADADGCVAAYNVHAYQSGKLETVDVRYLSYLGSGAVPYLRELAEAPDPDVAKSAKEALAYNYVNQTDFRSWNYTDSRAAEILHPQEAAEVREYP